uniref:HD domain containing 2 n=1 Tax=Eptatretus burgeri TaxID=7764 RepID=A0A8C4QVJ6_EPTBU
MFPVLLKPSDHFPSAPIAQSSSFLFSPGNTSSLEGGQSSTLFACKRTERAGWVHRGIRSPESVSDHMYRMAIMAFLPQDPVLCKERCMKMALVHDMAEALVGDITPADNIPAHEKHRREEPDLAPPLTIKVMGWCVVLKPRTPPSQPRVPVSAV